MVAHTVRKGSDSIIQYQQGLVLILLEGLQEGSKDELEIGQELSAGLLFKCSKRAASRLLNSLVRIQHSLQQLEGRG